MNQASVRSCPRRGVTTVQVVVMLSAITLAILVSLRSLGTRASSDLNTTAGNVANPATLPARFGS